MSLFRKIKRIGTDTQRFQFDMRIESLELLDNISCPIQICWTRGHRTAATNWQQANGTGTVFFNENLTLMSTMYRDKEDGSYKVKKSKLELVVRKDSKSSKEKTKAVCKFDLSQFALIDGSTNYEFLLETVKTGVPVANLTVIMHSRWLKELDKGKSDDRSSQTSILTTQSSLDDVPGRGRSGSSSGSSARRGLEADHSPQGAVPDKVEFTSRVDYPRASMGPGVHQGQTPADSSNTVSMQVGFPRARADPEPENRLVKSKTHHETSFWRLRGGTTEELKREYELNLQRLQNKYDTANQQLREISTHFTQMEVSLVQSKMELVNAVDRMNDLEVENMRLREQLEQAENAPKVVVKNLFTEDT